jgi:site-specific recombinase XerD
VATSVQFLFQAGSRLHSINGRRQLASQQGEFFVPLPVGKVWRTGISQNIVWYVVKTCCERAGLQHIAPHDLRRTCAKLCHGSGGELEQIQFLLGHASVQTTERYLDCKQNLGNPVNDRFDLGAERQRTGHGCSSAAKTAPR